PQGGDSPGLRRQADHPGGGARPAEYRRHLHRAQADSEEAQHQRRDLDTAQEHRPARRITLYSPTDYLRGDRPRAALRACDTEHLMSLNIIWFLPTHGDGKYLGTAEGARA